ncbi:hypothetical protein ACFQS6_08520 [Xanthomonas populi]
MLLASAIYTRSLGRFVIQSVGDIAACLLVDVNELSSCQGQVVVQAFRVARHGVVKAVHHLRTAVGHARLRVLLLQYQQLAGIARDLGGSIADDSHRIVLAVAGQGVPLEGEDMVVRLEQRLQRGFVGERILRCGGGAGFATPSAEALGSAGVGVACAVWRTAGSQAHGEQEGQAIWH